MNKKQIIIIILFLVGFMVGYLIDQDLLSNKEIIVEKDSFPISVERCDLLNTFREDPEDLDLNIISNSESKTKIDFRTKDKFNNYPISKNALNLPMYEVILNPGKYEPLMKNRETSFICMNYNDFGPTFKVCNHYFPHMMYLLYELKNISIDKIEVESRDNANEWDYYELGESSKNQNFKYIVFYPQMESEDSTLLNPERIYDQKYLNKVLDKEQEYKILCTNDFSCLHSWSIMEKLRSYGFNNILNATKSIITPENKDGIEKINDFFLKNHKELNMNINENRLTLMPGNYKIDEDFIIPEHLSFFISPFTNISLSNNSSIKIFNDIFIKGPVNINSSDTNIRGLIVNGNNFAECKLEKVNFFWSKKTSVSGFPRESILLDSCQKTVINNSRINSIHIKKGDLKIIDSKFSSNHIHQDSLGMENINADIVNSTFIYRGEPGEADGIDCSDSVIRVTGSNFTGFSDKAISLDEGNKAEIKRNFFIDNNIAISIKEGSKVDSEENIFSGNNENIMENVKWLKREN